MKVVVYNNIIHIHIHNLCYFIYIVDGKLFTNCEKVKTNRKVMQYSYITVTVHLNLFVEYNLITGYSLRLV